MSVFDELRFGPQKTLNLREGLPASIDAVRRAEAWLYEHQVRGTKEVLIVTGRGNQSFDGAPVIRPAVEKLLFSLRRRGVIASHQAHNPGAFAVQLAPVRSQVEAPQRRRERSASLPPAVEVAGLSGESTDLLRQLAERSLSALGVAIDEAGLRDEMHRYLAVIVRGLPATRTEEQLLAALRTAIAEFD